MATVKTVIEAKRFFGLPDNATVVEIIIDQLPANWNEVGEALPLMQVG